MEERVHGGAMEERVHIWAAMERVHGGAMEERVHIWAAMERVRVHMSDHGTCARAHERPWNMCTNGRRWTWPHGMGGDGPGHTAWAAMQDVAAYPWGICSADTSMWPEPGSVRAP